MSSSLLICQQYVTIPSCAALLVSVAPIRYVVAPRMLRQAEQIGGVKSLQYASWKNVNPAKMHSFLSIIFQTGTAAYCLEITLPLLTSDETFLLLIQTIASHRHNFTKVLCLKKCQLLTSVVLPEIPKLRQLEILDLSMCGARMMRQADLSVLASLRWLKELNLDWCPIDDNSIKGLGKLPRLRKLSCSHTNVRDFTEFAGSPLEYLSATNMRLFTGDVILFTGLKNMFDLDMSHTGRSTAAFNWGQGAADADAILESAFEGIDALVRIDVHDSLFMNLNFLAPVLPTLQILEADDCQYLLDLKFLAEARELKVFTLSSRDLKDEHLVPHIYGARNLAKIDLSSCRELTDLRFLTSCPKLREIYCRKIVKLKHIEGFERLKHLEVLALDMCHSLCDDIIALAHAPRLATLSLCGHQALQPKHIEGLEHSSSMRLLDLRDCNKQFFREDNIDEKFKKICDDNSIQLLLSSRKAHSLLNRASHNQNEGMNEIEDEDHEHEGQKEEEGEGEQEEEEEGMMRKNQKKKEYSDNSFDVFSMMNES